MDCVAKAGFGVWGFVIYWVNIVMKQATNTTRKQKAAATGLNEWTVSDEHIMNGQQAISAMNCEENDWK
jgi:hypothetical protein